MSESTGLATAPIAVTACVAYSTTASQSGALRNQRELKQHESSSLSKLKRSREFFAATHRNLSFDERGDEGLRNGASPACTKERV